MGRTGLQHRDLPPRVLAALRRDGMIPAHPFALTAARTVDPVRRRVLRHDHIDAGASGLALAAATATATAASWPERAPVLIEGLVGRTVPGHTRAAQELDR
jgi:hypothetical protein